MLNNSKFLNQRFSVICLLSSQWIGLVDVGQDGLFRGDPVACFDAGEPDMYRARYAIGEVLPVGQPRRSGSWRDIRGSKAPVSVDYIKEQRTKGPDRGSMAQQPGPRIVRQRSAGDLVVHWRATVCPREDSGECAKLTAACHRVANLVN
jgi:hypothetical protein